MAFPEYQFRLAPPALAGLWGRRWWDSMGAGKEDLADAASDAVTAGMVLESPTDSLARHGADVVLERLPGEAVERFRGRIWNAWETWSWAASKRGIVAALRELGYTAVVVSNADWGAVPPDGDVSDWSRLWVFLTGHPFTFPTWGGGTWGAPGRRWGSSASPEDLEVLRRVLRKWIGARDRVVSLSIVSGAVWGAASGPWGVSLWGAGGSWGSVGWGSGVWGGVVVSYTSGGRWGSGSWGDIRRFPIWGRQFFV